MKKRREHVGVPDRRKLPRRPAEFRETRSFAMIRRRIERFVGRFGRRPRILISSMGEKDRDRQTRLLATLLAETGFDVDIGPLRQTPRGTARMAIENDVHIVCFLSRRDLHKHLVTDLVTKFKAEHAENIGIVIGGAIPRADYDFLYDAGVGLILNSATLDEKSINRLLDLSEKVGNDI